MRQVKLFEYTMPSCPDRYQSEHNGLWYCKNAEHFDRWHYHCHCPPFSVFHDWCPVFGEAIA